VRALEEDAARLARAHAELDEARAELGVLQAKLQDHERTAAVAGDVTKLRDEVENAEAQAAELEAELQAARWDREELEQRLKEVLAQGQAGGGAGAAELAKAKEELATRVAEVVLLKRQLAEREAVVAELTSRPQLAPAPTPVPVAPDGHVAAQAAADHAKAEALQEQLAAAIRRAADAEAALDAAKRAPGEPAGGDTADALKRAATEKEALVVQITERDQRITRLQREVADKTDRLGRLAKEMGELKAKGRGFFG
jgi:chromosome segregation ATPase